MALVDTEAIRDAVAFCVGEGITIYWDGEAETPMATVPYVVSPAGACRVRLSLSTAIQVGEDDVRNVHNTNSDLIETTYAGNRLATLSLRIEADAREEAYETAERVRTRLRFRTPHALLKAANISIATIENNQGIDYSWDNRDISACILDIRLNIGSNDRDEDTTFIETVNTNNEVPGHVYCTYYNPSQLPSSLAVFEASHNILVDIYAAGGAYWFDDRGDLDSFSSPFLLYCYPDIWPLVGDSRKTPANLLDPYPPHLEILNQSTLFNSSFENSSLGELLDNPDGYLMQFVGTWDEGQTAVDSSVNETCLVCVMGNGFAIWPSRYQGDTLRVQHNGGPSVGARFTPGKKTVCQVRYLKAEQTLQIRTELGPWASLESVANVSDLSAQVQLFLLQSSLHSVGSAAVTGLTTFTNSSVHSIVFSSEVDSWNADKLFIWGASKAGIAY